MNGEDLEEVECFGHLKMDMKAVGNIWVSPSHGEEDWAKCLGYISECVEEKAGDSYGKDAYA